MNPSTDKKDICVWKTVADHDKRKTTCKTFSPDKPCHTCNGQPCCENYIPANIQIAKTRIGANRFFYLKHPDGKTSQPIPSLSELLQAYKNNQIDWHE